MQGRDKDKVDSEGCVCVFLCVCMFLWFVGVCVCSLPSFKKSTETYYGNNQL